MTRAAPLVLLRPLYFCLLSSHDPGYRSHRLPLTRTPRPLHALFVALLLLALGASVTQVASLRPENPNPKGFIDVGALTSERRSGSVQNEGASEARAFVTPL